MPGPSHVHGFNIPISVVIPRPPPSPKAPFPWSHFGELPVSCFSDLEASLLHTSSSFRKWTSGGRNLFLFFSYRPLFPFGGLSLEVKVKFFFFLQRPFLNVGPAPRLFLFSFLVRRVIYSPVAPGTFCPWAFDSVLRSLQNQPAFRVDAWRTDP